VEVLAQEASGLLIRCIPALRQRRLYLDPQKRKSHYQYFDWMDYRRPSLKGKGVVIRHRTKKMLHIQFDLIDATIPRQLGNDEMFSMKIAS
jgi:hypothetical protein